MTKAPPAKKYGERNFVLVALLAKRNMTIDSLATMIFSGPAHLSQVLRGQRRGTRTWAKLLRVLNADEMNEAVKFANGTLAKKNLELVIEKPGAGQPADTPSRVVLKNLSST